MIPIVWWRFNVDQLRGIDTDTTVQGVHSTIMYSDMFPEPEFEYHYDFDSLKPNQNALVVVNAGAWHPEFVDVLNHHLATRAGSIVFVVFNEDNHLDLGRLNCSRIWTQEPKPGLHDSVRRLPLGYTRWAKKVQSPPRTLDWFFSGRLHHIPEWHSAITSLDGGFKNEVSVCDDGIQVVGHLDSAEYMRLLCSSKVAVCRPGNCTPETSRVYEALEVGCVPIVPRYPPEGHWKQYYGAPHYWEYVLGENPPFPVIDHPKELADCLKNTLLNWHQLAPQVSVWWEQYKLRLKQELRDELLR